MTLLWFADEEVPARKIRREREDFEGTSAVPENGNAGAGGVPADRARADDPRIAERTRPRS